MAIKVSGTTVVDNSRNLTAATVNGTSLQISGTTVVDGSRNISSSDISVATANSLSFGSATRQMVNLWSTSYGIGVQNSTTYFRSGGRFSWHRGGSHSNTENDPGTGGSVAMTLDGSSNLTVNGPLISLKGNFGSSSLQIGDGIQQQYAYIDFVGDTTYTDYGFRIIRNNTGANATSALFHRGTGEFQMYVQDAAPIVFYTSGIERARITDTNFHFNSGYGSAAVAYGCRAWVNFNGTGIVAIRADGNVSSITDNGTGNYTVNFTTSMPDTNYAAIANAANANAAVTYQVNGGNRNTNSVQIYPITNSVSLVDALYVDVAVFR